MKPARFEITAEQIERVVARFYETVRTHPALGPVFAVHISAEAWPAHEEKITRFWRNAILHERCYDGNPMQTHMQTLNVKADHFSVWLSLFDAALSAELPAETAAQFSTLAHRIGRGLKMGVEEFRLPEGGIPTLKRA